MQNKHLTYKTKPFNGSKMGEKRFMGVTMIAINLKKLEDARDKGVHLLVLNREAKDIEFMEFIGIPAPLSVGIFESKWNEGEQYTLYYYVWNPKKQLSFL